jgi:hypothetical protein
METLHIITGYAVMLAVPVALLTELVIRFTDLVKAPTPASDTPELVVRGYRR